MRCCIVLATLILAHGGLAQVATRPATNPVDPPTRVSLEFNNAHPRDVLAALAKQAGVAVRTSPKNLWEHQEFPPITISVKDVTYFAALKEVSEKTGLNIQRASAEQALTVSQAAFRQWHTYPMFESGQFLIVAQSLYRAHAMDPAAPQETTRTCTLRMTLYTEPKVRLLRASSLATIERAVDENGKSLLGTPTTSTTPDRTSVYNPGVWSVSASLSPGPDAGRKIAVLKGVVRGAVQGQAKSVEFDNILAARNVSKVNAGCTLTVKEVRKISTSYTLTLNLKREKDAPAVLRELSPTQHIKLVDAEGRALMRRTYANPPSGDSVDFTLNFAQDDFAAGDQTGEPVKLVWEVPVEVREIEIPFEFRDIPLP